MHVAEEDGKLQGRGANDRIIFTVVTNTDNFIAMTYILRNIRWIIAFLVLVHRF